MNGREKQFINIMSLYECLAFWCINIGLLTLVLISLLSMGLMQAWASGSVRHANGRSRGAGGESAVSPEVPE
jgi:nitric oxide reductase large subunit